jgi:hypothetical protein
MPDYAWDRAHDQGPLTARDLQRIGWAGPVGMRDESGDLLPPQDVGAHVFSCCATCAITEPTRRCSDCPRGDATSKLVERIKRCHE